MEHNQWIALLKQDVVPALGCTEPVCVALCAAYAGGHNIPKDIIDTVVKNNNLDLADIACKIEETFWK